MAQAEPEATGENRIEIEGRPHELEAIDASTARGLRDEQTPEKAVLHDSFFAIAALRDHGEQVTDVLYAGMDGQRVVNVEYSGIRDEWNGIKRSIWVKCGTGGPEPTPDHLSNLVNTVLYRYCDVYRDYDGPLAPRDECDGADTPLLE